jgi:uncharacterized protein (DUF2235 family)
LKRLVFCFDGTWNKLSAEWPPNVVLVAEMVKPIASDGTPQIVYYDEGIGTAKDERFTGGAFGKGMMVNIREAYRFLLFNYEPGDHIFAFGFSRGAFTARSFVGFIRHAGILDVDNAKEIERAIELYKGVFKGDGDDALEALEFRAKHCSQVCVSEWDRKWRIENYSAGNWENSEILQIKYVGVWDTVAALGCPKFVPGATFINRKFGYHDAKLTSKVQAARHAVAIDERRVLFEPVLWNNVRDLNAKHGSSIYESRPPYQQKWFPGVHGAVGGGGPIRGLSDATLTWILSGAKRQGLQIRGGPQSRAFQINPDPFAPLRNDPDLAWHDKGLLGKIKGVLLMSDRLGPDDIAMVSAPALKRWSSYQIEKKGEKRYRPKTLSKLASKIGQALGELDDYKIYEVQNSDTLGSIAKALLGDISHYELIFDANRDQLDDPDDISIGMKLRIPQNP